MSSKYYKRKMKNLERENMFLEEALWEFDSMPVRPFLIINALSKRNHLLGQFSKMKKLKEIK